MKIVNYSEPHGTLAAGGGKCPHKKKKNKHGIFEPHGIFAAGGGKCPHKKKKQNKHGIFADGAQNAHTRKKQTRHFRRWEGQGAHTRKKNKQMGNTYI